MPTRVARNGQSGASGQSSSVITLRPGSGIFASSRPQSYERAKMTGERETSAWSVVIL